MATTRIMPLHTGKCRTVRRAIRDIIGYVKNPEKTDDGRLVTSYACDSRTPSSCWPSGSISRPRAGYGERMM